MEPQSDQEMASTKTRASAVAILERMHADNVRVHRDGEFDGAQVVAIVVVPRNGAHLDGSTEDGSQFALNVVAMC